LAVYEIIVGLEVGKLDSRVLNLLRKGYSLKWTEPCLLEVKVYIPTPSFPSDFQIESRVKRLVEDIVESGIPPVLERVSVWCSKADEAEKFRLKVNEIFSRVAKEIARKYMKKNMLSNIVTLEQQLELR